MIEPSADAKEFRDLLQRVIGDDRVAGVVLTGSRAREGAATEHSDYDVYVLTYGAPALLPDGQRRRDGRLDAFCNSLYRWLKNDRDGRRVEARLDAAETLPWLLGFIFAVHERVRPYNKWLLQDLAEHPLGPAELAADRLVPLLEEVMDIGAATAGHRLFAIVEPLARAAGHGEVIDDWGHDVALMRGGPDPQAGSPSG